MPVGYLSVMMARWVVQALAQVEVEVTKFQARVEQYHLLQAELEQVPSHLLQADLEQVPSQHQLLLEVQLWVELEAVPPQHQ